MFSLVGAFVFVLSLSSSIVGVTWYMFAVMDVSVGDSFVEAFVPSVSFGFDVFVSVWMGSVCAACIVLVSFVFSVFESVELCSLVSIVCMCEIIIWAGCEECGEIEVLKLLRIEMGFIVLVLVE